MRREEIYQSMYICRECDKKNIRSAPCILVANWLTDDPESEAVIKSAKSRCQGTDTELSIRCPIGVGFSNPRWEFIPFDEGVALIAKFKKESYIDENGLVDRSNLDHDSGGNTKKEFNRFSEIDVI